MSGEQELELIGGVDSPPIEREPHDNLPDEKVGCLLLLHVLGHFGAVADAGENGFDRIARVKVNQVLLGKVIERHEVLPVLLQA